MKNTTLLVFFVLSIVSILSLKLGAIDNEKTTVNEARNLYSSTVKKTSTIEEYRIESDKIEDIDKKIILAELWIYQNHSKYTEVVLPLIVDYTKLYIIKMERYGVTKAKLLEIEIEAIYGLKSIYEYLDKKCGDEESVCDRVHFKEKIREFEDILEQLEKEIRISKNDIRKCTKNCV